MHTLETLPFSNSFATLPAAFYARVQPTPLEKPAKLIHFNTAAAELLNLDPDVANHPDFADHFSGMQLLPGMEPIAMLYAGHQFGHYVSQLGDGRAIMLGETTNQHGEKWEIQLKGSGQTPWSRDGDGRAVLRSTIREYLCSEALYGLGIPTTRALCITGSEDEVYREQIETAAIITRLAPSHVRFGSFEIFFYRNQHGELRQLADYVIRQHYPELLGEADPYIALLQNVVERTARLMAQWQAVGFAHGVMNTDNMSVLGITLDYGPFGFMEAWDPGFICNHSDHHGLYAFDKQPQRGLFNLSCFAQALLPLIEVESAKTALESYQPAFLSHHEQLLAEKLGFERADENINRLGAELLAQMAHSRTDYTNLFRALGDIEAAGTTLCNLFIDRERFNRWRHDYLACLQQNTRTGHGWRNRMQRRNPKYILRNYMAQIAIDKATGEQDYTEIDRLFRLLQKPFDEHPDMAHYAATPPDWAKGIQVSCSS
ncbi:MAG: YdiU family protein [Gammaproteobacteria bacterium]